MSCDKRKSTSLHSDNRVPDIHYNEINQKVFSQNLNSLIEHYHKSPKKKPPIKRGQLLKNFFVGRNAPSS